MPELGKRTFCQTKPARARKNCFTEVPCPSQAFSGSRLQYSGPCHTRASFFHSFAQALAKPFADLLPVSEICVSWSSVSDPLLNRSPGSDVGLEVVPLGGGVLVLGWLHLPEVGQMGGELVFVCLFVVPFLCSFFLAGPRGVDPSCLFFSNHFKALRSAGRTGFLLWTRWRWKCRFGV